MSRPISQLLLALTAIVNAATVCWAGCFSTLNNGSTRYWCNQATGVSHSFRPDPISACQWYYNGCFGCNSSTLTNSERDQTWNGSNCTGQVIADTGWYTINPTPVSNDYLYSCC